MVVLCTFSFNFKPLKCRKYKIVADRDGYAQALDFFEVPCDADSDEVIERPIYLIPGIYDLLPIRLFFDNDIPDKRTTRRTTRKKYTDTYFPYYASKDKFIEEYGEARPGDEKQQRIDLESFFENDVKYGYERLNFFMKALEYEMTRGNTIEIMIKGHASPRAASSYNKRLGSRRISSVLNEFRNFKGGVMAPYIDRGMLKVTEAAVGEDEAPSGISDDLNDRRNSIFSPDASWERRVEIIRVQKLNGQ